MPINIATTPSAENLVGKSHWWGAPDLPESIPYPYEEVTNADGTTYPEPLTFVCQIRCRDIAPLDVFYFRNCFNLPDQIFLPADTVTKTKAERSVATLGDTSLFYDFSAEQSFEVQSGGLTPAECHLAAQLFTSHEVNKPYTDGIEELDFDAMLPILITESTCEFSRHSDKPNSVKFTWRYAANGCTHPALPFSDIFTEPFNYVFK